MSSRGWKNNGLVIIFLALFLMACSSDTGVREVQTDTIFAPDEHEDALTVHFFNLESSESESQSGESILVHTPDGKDILIDAGKPEFGSLIDDYLNEMGIDTLDYVLPSHPHADHIGGLLTLFETKEVNQILDIHFPHNTETYENYVQLIEDKDIPIEQPDPYERLEIADDIEFEILAPEQEKVEAYTEMEEFSPGIVNDLSMVIKLTYKDTSFLFTGDIYEDAEHDLIESYGEDLEADVMVVPHHGKGESSSEAFIETVDSDISIIASNLLMSQSIYEKYRENGSQVYVNAFDGNILVTSDGSKIDVYTEKEREKMQADYID